MKLKISESLSSTETQVLFSVILILKKVNFKFKYWERSFVFLKKFVIINVECYSF